MKRQGKKAGARRTKASRDKTPPARRRARSSAKDRASSASDPQRDLNDALDQLKATSEVLHLMSGSQGDLAGLFKTILTNATRLSKANFGILTLREGDAFRIVATHNAPRAFADLRKREPVIRPGPLIRVAATKKLLHLPDLTAHESFKRREPEMVAFVELTGVRSVVVVPMLRDNEVVGAVATYRREVLPFTDRQIELVQSFAAQAVIAIENTRLLAEQRAALERQTASAEILRTIASAPGDAGRSLQQIAETTARLFGASSVSIRIADGDRWGQTIHVGTGARRIAAAVPAAQLNVGGRNMPGVVMRANRQIQVADLDNPDPEVAAWPGLPHARAAGTRTLAGTPLRREGQAIGTLIVHRDRLAPFTADELALQQSFADQAVIAIENARLLGELRESLAQQTATADILRVISCSQGDLKPVFETLLANAVRLCDAKFGNLSLVVGDGLQMAAMHNAPKEFERLRTRDPRISLELSPLGTLFRTKKAVNVADLTADKAYAKAPLLKVAGARAALCVPMLRGGDLVGAIVIYRMEPVAFSEKQTELLTSFAAQAVIAIENARLLNELRERTDDLTESLEQQTATSEVLRVISSSPGDLEPVFATMLEKAVRICDATFGNIFDWDGDSLKLIAAHNTPVAFREMRRQLRHHDDSKSLISQMIATKMAVHIADMAAEPAYQRRDPRFVSAVEVGGVRTFLAVPMLKDDQLIGAIILCRQEVRPFTDKQIALVTSFANQAVIAIENTRLLSELRESLAQQTATADILKVIASSPSDVQPVFNAVVLTARRLLRREMAAILLCDNNATFRPRAITGPEGLIPVLNPDPIKIDPAANFPSRAIVSKKNQHLPDWSTIDLPEEERNIQKMYGLNSSLYLPMVRGGECIGVLLLGGAQPGIFSGADIALAESFRDQAVIAIENARLLSELRESLAQQTATADVLRIISSTPGELEPVFQAMQENASRLCEAPFGTMLLRDGDVLRIVARHVPPTAPAMFERGSEMVISENTTHPVVRVVNSKEVIQIADLLTEPSYIEGNPRVVAFVDLIGARTALCVPMLKDNECIGAFVNCRLEVRPFGDKQIELVKNFAAQAVIAIENARLLTELRQRTDDLTVSLEQQTATSEVLGVISRSKFELQPILQSVVDTAMRLCRADQAVIFRQDNGVYRFAAGYSVNPEYLEIERQNPILPGPETVVGRAALSRSVARIDDAWTDPLYQKKRDAKIAGVRSMIGVPLMREGEPIGVIALARGRVEPFVEREIELVATFADQAVIAIENVRLFEAEQQRTRELTESLEQQTATSEVLKVISSSPGDLQPVFQSMLENATRLCGATFGVLTLAEGDAFRIAAMDNMPANFTGRFQVGFAFQPGPRAPLSRAAAAKDAVQISDLTQDAAYRERDPVVVGLVEEGAVRSILVVPMLKERELIGALSVYRQEVQAFTDKQVDLVKNFAAQAVIAIENTRLLSELRESLQQQIATSEVLKVISSSPGELQPVFATMLEKAVRICDAKFGNVYRWDGEALNMVAALNTPAAFAEAQKRSAFRPRPNSPISRMLATKSAVHIADIQATESYLEGDPVTVASFELAGLRTLLVVPMLKDNELIGALTLNRQEVRPFTDKQIALVTGFANQAVIAIENTRLLSELREALEQQTATAEVLQVISSSPGDLEPVFSSMLENAVRICGAKFGNIYRWEDRIAHLVAAHNTPPAFAEARGREPQRVERNPLMGRMLATKMAVQVADIAATPGYHDRSNAAAVATVDLGGARTVLLVPMLKENEPIGSFTLFRDEVRPFTDKQIALVSSFAAQAVIAIENTRLLTELRQRTDDLGRSVGELQALGEVSQAVNSTLDLETVLSTIVAKAVQLSGTEAGAIYVFDEMRREFHLRATYGMENELIDALKLQRIGIDETNIAAAMGRQEPIQVADLRDEAQNPINTIILRAGFRARLTAPLVRGKDIVGMLVVRRRTPGAFPQNTVDLMKTFAAQSVLAIQNARLFHEIEDKRQELEVAGRHKSQFLANMSHELRTPLNAIIGYSEILQEEAVDLGQESLVPDLKKVEGAGRHLLGLINDILDLSKVEAGRMDIFLEDVDVVPLLDEVRALIVPMAEKNGNAFELRLAGDLGTIRTDRTKLKQSLLNILSNACKFTENGRLTVVAERFETDRPMVRFVIADTGIGMTEDQLGRLFQAFSQADASTTKKYGGTGLGLAISRQFCQLLGGGITVTSRPGEGSTFTITLPARSDAAAQLKPADAPHIAADANDGSTVLIVDDDPAARELLVASLKGAGYRFVHAASGAEALNLARTIRPDAITLDVMMPKPDGWDVLSALKADPDLCDIPVIIVTMVPDRGIGLSLGAVDVLTKPVDRARLTALIHRLVRREGPVLVVEDDANTREMMRHTIEKMGLSVAEAVNGRRAVSWLGEHQPPAMILLDLMMPEMDGFEFLDALGARPEWREIPVVVITAKQLSAAERERLLRQARKVMEKATASRVDVAAAVSDAVRRRPARAGASVKGK